jgi:hypothetical protein
MATAKEILAQERAHLGISESPDGSNKTPFGVQYGMNGVAWCAIFQSCMFQDMSSLPLIYGKHSYTPNFAKEFYDRDRWIPRNGVVKVGDLAFFAWNGSSYQGRWKGISHVGIVESVKPDGSLITIEGNVGNSVRRLVRSRTYIAGFGRPAYTPEPVAPKPEAKPVYPNRILKRGDSGTSVKLVQKELNHDIKAGLVADGVFGSKTEAAVKKFQKARGLVVDGQVGKKTWAKLFA